MLITAAATADEVNKLQVCVAALTQGHMIVLWASVDADGALSFGLSRHCAAHLVEHNVRLSASFAQ